MDYFQLRDFHKALNADVAKKARERGSTPPWLKDQAGQLEDPEYVLLSLAERGFLKDLRLLALRRGNKIRNDEHYLRVQLRLTPRTRTGPKVSRLRELGFLEPYNPATNVAANELVPSRDSLDPSESKVRPEEEGEEKYPLTPLEGERISRKELRRYTGCRYVYNGRAAHYVRHPLGTDKPPDYWPHERPNEDEVLRALEERNAA